MIAVRMWWSFGPLVCVVLLAWNVSCAALWEVRAARTVKCVSSRSVGEYACLSLVEIVASVLTAYLRLVNRQEEGSRRT